MWDALVRSFSNQIRSAFASSSFAKETFVGGFARLVAMLEGIADRIVRDTDVRAIASTGSSAGAGTTGGLAVGGGSAALSRAMSSVNVGVGKAAAAAWQKGATPPAIGAAHKAQLLGTLDQFQVRLLPAWAKDVSF